MEDHGDGCTLIPFADPGNANLKLMTVKGLKVIPVVSNEVRKMSDKKLNGQAIYQLQKFNLKAAGMFVNPGEATAAVRRWTSLAERRRVFGNDLDKVDSQNELIQAIRNIPAEKLQANPVLAAVVRFPKRLSERASWQGRASRKNAPPEGVPIDLRPSDR